MIYTCIFRYCNNIVAVKQFLTASQVDLALAEAEGATLPAPAEEEVVSADEALFLFRDLRQEVTVLAQLDNPYVVSVPLSELVLCGSYVCMC